MTNKSQLNDDLINVKSLIAQGANIHAKNNEALRMSAGAGYLEVVKYLVEHGADIHAEEGALKYSIRHGYFNVIKYLIEQGADIHVNNNYFLIKSAEYGYLESVKYLVDKGANIYAENDETLKISTIYDNLDIVNFLIFNCNMTVKAETLEYVRENNLLEIINIINIRDLQNDLKKDLKYNDLLQKAKVKV